jgi:hypothetical protein
LIAPLLRGASFAYRTDDRVVGGKEDPAFLGHLAIVHPDSEFTSPAFYKFGVDSERIFDSGRRTGGPGSIRSSDLTETNSHVTHSPILSLNAIKEPLKPPPVFRDSIPSIALQWKLDES